MENSSLCARLLPASASSADRIPSPEFLLEQLESKQRLIKPFCFGYSSSGLFSSKVLKQAFLLKTEFRVS